MLGNGENDWGFAPNPTREHVPLTLTTLSLCDSWGGGKKKLLHNFKTPQSEDGSLRGIGIMRSAGRFVRIAPNTLTSFFSILKDNSWLFPLNPL